MVQVSHSYNRGQNYTYVNKRTTENNLRLKKERRKVKTKQKYFR